MRELSPSFLFEEGHSLVYPYLIKYENAYEILPDLKGIILEIGKNLAKDEYLSPEEGIWIHKSAKVAPSATLIAPLIVGANTEIRTGAFLRGSVIIGDNCVFGNSCEGKNAVISDNTQVPHFSYVGDSILGYKSHLGAAAITSNFKSDHSNVSISINGEKVPTGLRKFGALVGDEVEVGCSSILCPGSVIGKRSIIYPLSLIRGYVAPSSIYKKAGEIAERK